MTELVFVPMSPILACLPEMVKTSPFCHQFPEKERLFLVERVRLNAIENPNQLLPPLPTFVQIHEQASNKSQTAVQTKIRKPLKVQIPTATSSKPEIQIRAPTQTQTVRVIQIQSNNSQLFVQAPQNSRSILLPKPKTTLVQMQAPKIRVDDEHDYTRNGQTENFKNLDGVEN